MVESARCAGGGADNALAGAAVRCGAIPAKPQGRAAKIDVGFRSRGVIMMSVDPQLHRYTPDRAVLMLREVRERVASLPGVIAATTTDGVPLSGGTAATVSRYQENRSRRARTSWNCTW